MRSGSMGQEVKMAWVRSAAVEGGEGGEDNEEGGAVGEDAGREVRTTKQLCLVGCCCGL